LGSSRCAKSTTRPRRPTISHLAKLVDAIGAPAPPCRSAAAPLYLLPSAGDSRRRSSLPSRARRYVRLSATDGRVGQNPPAAPARTSIDVGFQFERTMYRFDSNTRTTTLRPRPRLGYSSGSDPAAEVIVRRRLGRVSPCRAQARLRRRVRDTVVLNSAPEAEGLPTWIGMSFDGRSFALTVAGTAYLRNSRRSGPPCRRLAGMPCGRGPRTTRASWRPDWPRRGTGIRASRRKPLAPERRPPMKLRSSRAPPRDQPHCRGFSWVTATRRHRG